jgi:hypothetical protein
MEKVEFRGLLKNRNGWVYGLPTHDFTHILPIDSSGNCEVIPETVGIFTGFLDKNGKKIYIGDLIKRDENQFHIVIFRQGKFVLKFRDINPYIEFSENSVYEIIGNFHENYDMALQYAYF